MPARPLEVLGDLECILSYRRDECEGCKWHPDVCAHCVESLGDGSLGGVELVDDQFDPLVDVDMFNSKYIFVKRELSMKDACQLCALSDNSLCTMVDCDWGYFLKRKNV